MTTKRSRDTYLPGLVQERERMFRERQTAQPAPITDSKGGNHYDGAELRPFDARPGAMDAYRLPSKGFRT